MSWVRGTTLPREAVLWNFRRVGNHHRLGYRLTPIPHNTDLKLVIRSSVVRAYHTHFCSMDGKWLRHTSLVWGEQTSVHDSHFGMVSGSPNIRTTPFRVSEIGVARGLSVASAHTTLSDSPRCHTHLCSPCKLKHKIGGDKTRESDVVTPSYPFIPHDPRPQLSKLWLVARVWLLISFALVGSNLGHLLGNQEQSVPL